MVWITESKCSPQMTEENQDLAKTIIQCLELVVEFSQTTNNETRPSTYTGVCENWQIACTKP